MGMWGVLAGLAGLAADAQTAPAALEGLPFERFTTAERRELDAFFTRMARAILRNNLHWVKNNIGDGVDNHLASLFDLKAANGRTLKQAFDAIFDVLAPDLTVPPIGDAYGWRPRLSENDAYYRETAVRQVGESLILIGEEPAALAYMPLRGQRVRLRSSYLPGNGTISYFEGEDFVVDYDAGTVRRTEGSRVPDFRNNVLFGQETFHQSKFPGYGNEGFFAFADYAFVPPRDWPQQPAQTKFLRASHAKLAAGGPLTIVAFGDSITAGGDASKPEHVFWRRWIDDLRKQYPGANITAVNAATGGDTTANGLERLHTKVIAAQPDLVLIGFGMNDHNRRGVPLPQFEQNLGEMVARIRAATAAEIILFSAFPPNPRWTSGSQRMRDYAAATGRVAGESACAYADVFNNWQAIATRKKPEDLLANNINHPNDFGHWIYYRVFEELGL